MIKTASINSDTSFHKKIWAVYLLSGFQSLAFSGIIILIVPLSFLFWPNDPYHALEMGILISILFWISSIGGLLFGILIDKQSRKLLLFIISLFRGMSIFMLGFAIAGKGIETWTYFLVFIIIFGFFAGGAWPAIVSLSNDIIPKEHRSRFFGILGILWSLFNTFGFIFASIAFQFGYWRAFFWIIGLSIVIAGINLYIQIKEPKRGAQREELSDILKDDSIKYDFKIDRKLTRKTMLSKTNKVALFEGISTNILMGSVVLMILPYIQTEPHNLSPLFTGIYMAIFGLTGGLLGRLYLAKLSDKLCADHPIRRIYFVILALSIGITSFAVVFFLPLPHLTKAQGKDIFFVFTLPVIWIMGALFFTSSTISSLYLTNQAPILQEINLPEAQGKIASWNQLLERIGFGIGPILVGILLTISYLNYQFTIIIIVLFIIPGILLWTLALKWYPQDSNDINMILKERAEILKSRNKSL